MTRESDVVQSLVDLADTLVADYDVVDLLTRLADRCVHVLHATAAGVMLAAPSGELRLVASSSEAMRVLELFELQSHEGPCLDAFRTGQPVAHHVLHAETGRWPRFATVAVEAGFHAALAFPLRLRDTTIGALNLVSVDDTRMDDADLRVARAFADLATISVIQQRAVTDLQRVNEQLSHALNSRIIIEQAKGVIFERAGIDVTEAFARLRNYARSHSLRLTDVAQAAIDNTLDPEAWAPTPQPTTNQTRDLHPPPPPHPPRR
jgi:transcriptional regulator with GAF, ATPase, and Fis domain